MTELSIASQLYLHRPRIDVRPHDDLPYNVLLHANLLPAQAFCDPRGDDRRLSFLLRSYSIPLMPEKTFVNMPFDVSDKYRLR